MDKQALASGNIRLTLIFRRKQTQSIPRNGHRTLQLPFVFLRNEIVADLKRYIMIHHRRLAKIGQTN